MQKTIELYQKVDNKIQCNLCPHSCIMGEGEVGKCCVRKNKNGEIEFLNYGIVNAMAIDPISKKPFKHFLKGSKTLSIALSSHCNLSCKFCENHKLSQNNKIKGKNILPVSIVSDAIEKHCKSVSMSYNEPTISYEYLMDLADECHKNNLKFLLKTNAFVNKEPWKEICGVVDAVNIDFKGSEDKFKSIAGVNSYVLKDRIKEAYEAGVHIEISIPLYYQDDEIEDEIEDIGRFLSSIDKDIPCHLLRMSSSYRYTDFIFNFQNMEKAKNILLKYMDNIYMVV